MQISTTAKEQNNGPVNAFKKECQSKFRPFRNRQKWEKKARRFSVFARLGTNENSRCLEQSRYFSPII